MEELTRQEELFEQYRYFLTKWFYKPPVEAVELALTLYCAHFCLKEKPVWSFVIGPSSTGKSSIVLDPMRGLKSVRFVDTLTRNSLLSGNNSGGILNNLTSKDIFIIFSDFSTFVGLDDFQRQEIQGQLRRHYDMSGPVTKDTGVGNVSWEGKMTILAGCTPAIEKYWAFGRDLGERFLAYKMPYEESIVDQQSRNKKAKTHIGNEDHLKNTMVKSVAEILQGHEDFNFEMDQEANTEELDNTAIFTALMRRSVDHIIESGKRCVTNVSPSEGTGRLIKQLTNIAVGNGILFRHKGISERGIKLAKTTALYTIPALRYKVFAALMEAKDEDYTIRREQLKRLTGISETSFKHTIDDMEAMEVVEVEQTGIGTRIRPTEEMIELANSCKLITTLQRYSALAKKPKLHSMNGSVGVEVKGLASKIDWRNDVALKEID